MKKKIPLEILEALQPILESSSEIVKAKADVETLFHVVDVDEKSSFYFQILRQELSMGNPGYVIEVYPKNKTENIPFKVWTKFQTLSSYLEGWIKIIEAYNKIRTIYDDPILKANAARFENQFDILENDAKTSSFDLQQQIFLNEYLEKTIQKLENFKAGKSSEEISDLESLKIEASNIQKNLTTETKKEIIQKLSRFWGRTQKFGLDLIKEIFINVAAEIAKKLITGS